MDLSLIQVERDKFERKLRKEQMLLDFELVTLSAITEIQLSTVRRCSAEVLLHVVCNYCTLCGTGVGKFSEVLARKRRSNSLGKP